MWPEKPPYSMFLCPYPANVGPPAPTTTAVIVSAGPGGNLWSQKVWDMSWEPTVDFLSGSFSPVRVCWPNVICVSTSCQAESLCCGWVSFPRSATWAIWATSCSLWSPCTTAMLVQLGSMWGRGVPVSVPLLLSEH